MSPRLSRLALLLLACAVLAPASARLHAQQAPATPEALAAWGDQLLGEGAVEEAREAYQRAVELDENLTAAYLGLARAALEEKAWNEAESWLDRALAREPESTAAHYYRAIAYREIAKFRTLNQRHHWNESAREFEWVLQRDSLYRDVLAQYGLLKRYHGAYTDAIRLGHRQLQLKPDLENARQELFRFYSHFINHAGADEALAWLRAHPSDHATYFYGEKLRRLGRLEEADAVLQDLTARPLSIPLQPVLLSRAKILYAQERPEEAQALFEAAVAQISSPLEAGFVFDDIKYIIYDDELAEYEGLRAPEDYRAFFAAFWARRNPMPARPLNLRMMEHYRRLRKAEAEYAYDGFRLWHNNPDRRGDLAFPASYVLNDAFNDKGLIYIRHGEPADRQVHVGSETDFRTVKSDGDPYGTPLERSYEPGWRPSESWRYNSPRMDFHFVVEGGENGWRLAPEVSDAGMLEKLEYWGPPYSEMVAAVRAMQRIQEGKVENRRADIGLSEFPEQDDQRGADSTEEATSRLTLHAVPEHNRHYLEFTTVRQRMVEKSRRDVQQALTTDRHTWAEEVEPIDLPYQLAAFRGEAGETHLEIYFAVPVGYVTQQVGADAGTTEIELGYALHDLDWQPVVDSAQVKRLPTSPDRSAAVIDFFALSVPPDSYRVSIHGRPVETRQLGGHQFGYRVPDFSKPALAVSDLLLADHIGPARGGSRFDRGQLHISPNPFGRYFTHQPVFVYFEIYNLTLDARDQAQFTVEYVLTPEGGGQRKFLGLFGGSKRPALSLSVDRTAEHTAPVESAEVDVSSVDPGRYTLTVRITDRLTGAVSERSRPLLLVPPVTADDL